MSYFGFLLGNVWLTLLQTYLTALMQTFSTSMTNFTEMYEEKEMKQASGTYDLSGTLCTPKSGAKDSAQVQFLVHGVGFDSRCAWHGPSVSWLHG